MEVNIYDCSHGFVMMTVLGAIGTVFFLIIFTQNLKKKPKSGVMKKALDYMPIIIPLLVISTLMISATFALITSMIVGVISFFVFLKLILKEL